MTHPLPGAALRLASTLAMLFALSAAGPARPARADDAAPPTTDSGALTAW